MSARPMIVDALHFQPVRDGGLFFCHGNFKHGQPEASPESIRIGSPIVAAVVLRSSRAA